MKKIITLTLTISMLFCGLFTQNVSAKESINPVYKPENTNNDQYYDEDGNYYNTETGEYFIIRESKARTGLYEYEFKMRTSVAGARSFTFNKYPSGMLTLVSQNVHVENSSGQKVNVSKDKYKYTVSVENSPIHTTVSSITRTCPADNSTAQLSNKLQKGKSYRLFFATDKTPDYDYYLCGEGYVY